MKKSKVLLGITGLLLIGANLASCSKSTGLTLVRIDQSFLGDMKAELSVSIGIKKGNDELKTAINEALADLSKQQRDEMMEGAVNRSTNIVSGDGITTAPYDSSKPSLVVGLECNYTPFNWTQVKVNEFSWPIDGMSNQYADGYDVQVARYLATTLDYNLVIKKTSWEALIPALTTNDVNVVIAGMTDTEERRNSIDFSDTYYTSDLTLIVKKGSDLENITSVDQLKGKRLVSQISTVTDDIIDLMPGVIHLTPVTDFNTAALAVKTGDADAMTAEYPVALAIVNANK